MPGRRNSKCNSAEAEIHLVCSWVSGNPGVLVKPSSLGLAHSAHERCPVLRSVFLFPLVRDVRSTSFPAERPEAAIVACGCAPPHI